MEKLLEYGTQGLCLALIILVGKMITIESALRKKRMELDEKQIEAHMRLANNIATLTAKVEGLE